MARPRQPILSVERIAGAALKIVDRSGEFTIPGLAAELGVSPSSLYNHVSGRDEIVELMRGVASEGIHMPEDTSDWRAAVVEICWQYRNSYARHPRLIPLLTAYPVSHPSTTRMYNRLADVLAGLGLTPADVLKVITTLDSFVLGSALDVAAPEVVWNPGSQASPALAAALETPPPSTEKRAREAFGFGLDLVMDGLWQYVQTARIAAGAGLP
ncbi:TetR/AcrR family transcriptional regulator [Saxibacter everestensis]|uniref:TetR/AcrR family transcriptional regulator n=1 Tax=Saxibacter everestensis TaxID=2909229 RepID=A0ABY8QTD5_9MICO|nr:TetR/AcrR family transcriptional regulator [Brevibacteriaceae bacterium ZFBP1038]